jgi:hypothetical protein
MREQVYLNSKNSQTFQEQERQRESLKTTTLVRKAGGTLADEKAGPTQGRGSSALFEIRPLAREQEGDKRTKVEAKKRGMKKPSLHCLLQSDSWYSRGKTKQMHLA